MVRRTLRLLNVLIVIGAFGAAAAQLDCEVITDGQCDCSSAPFVTLSVAVDTDEATCLDLCDAQLSPGCCQINVTNFSAGTGRCVFMADGFRVPDPTGAYRASTCLGTPTPTPTQSPTLSPFTPSPSASPTSPTEQPSSGPTLAPTTSPTQESTASPTPAQSPTDCYVVSQTFVAIEPVVGCNSARSANKGTSVGQMSSGKSAGDLRGSSRGTLVGNTCIEKDSNFGYAFQRLWFGQGLFSNLSLSDFVGQNQPAVKSDFNGTHWTRKVTIQYDPNTTIIRFDQIAVALLDASADAFEGTRATLSYCNCQVDIDIAAASTFSTRGTLFSSGNTGKARKKEGTTPTCVTTSTPSNMGKASSSSRLSSAKSSARSGGRSSFSLIGTQTTAPTSTGTTASSANGVVATVAVVGILTVVLVLTVVIRRLARRQETSTFEEEYFEEEL